MTKAIALVSGGLDSILAARMMQEEGFIVEGVCFIMPFLSKDIDKFKERVKEVSDLSGVSVEFIDITEDYLKVLTSPRYGYGSHINPCIDCKILMLKKAKAIMQERSASFVITGEVLGERPMSQNKQSLEVIRVRSGLEGYLLRPLSAKVMEDSIPEQTGMVTKEHLGDISGRSRKKQFELAEKYGITKYFTPTGGCLLTDPCFSGRIKDLMVSGILEEQDIKLIKFGRHFRLDKKTKAIVGRDSADNDNILSLKGPKDVILDVKDKTSPTVLLRGDVSEVNIKKAASLCVSHSKSKTAVSEVVEYWQEEGKLLEVIVAPMPQEELDRLRV